MESFDRQCAAMMAAVEGFGVKSKSVKKSIRRCCRELRIHLESTGGEFSRSTGLSWLESVLLDDEGNRSAYMLNQQRRRTVLLLADCQEGKLTCWKAYPKKQAAMPTTACFCAIIDEYSYVLSSEEKAEATVGFATRVARDFLIFVEDCGITEQHSISAEIVTGYFLQEKFKGRKPAGIQAYAYRLRMFWPTLKTLVLSATSTCIWLYPERMQNR